MEIEKVELNLKKIIADYNLKFYKSSFIKEDGMDIFRIELDGDVNLDKCELISKEIGNFLEENDCFKEPYILDVCSVGIEKEIDLDKLELSIDAYVYVVFNKDINGLFEIEGYLRFFNQEVYMIEYLDKTRKKYLHFKKDDVEFIRNAIKF